MSQRITQAELAADVIDGLDDPTPGAIERATAEFPARSVASAAAASAAAAGGNGNGGSQPVEVVRVPIAFDTAGLAVQSFPQVSASAEDGAFVVAGNHTALFPADSALTATSDLNSGAYTVASSSFGGGNTTIVVNESVVDEGATGDIINAANGVTGSGIVAYTPEAGDTLLLNVSFASITTAWDGSSPTPWFYLDGAADYQNSLPLTFDLATADDEFEDAAVRTTSQGLFAKQALFFNTATPLKVVIDDGNNGAAGAAQGEGEIVLLILKAS